MNFLENIFVQLDRSGDAIVLRELRDGKSIDISGRELLQQVRERLSKEERQLADLRGQGYEWAEIAAQVGGTAHARRMQLARAANRVARRLGLDGESDE